MVIHLLFDGNQVDKVSSGELLDIGKCHEWSCKMSIGQTSYEERDYNKSNPLCGSLHYISLLFGQTHTEEYNQPLEKRYTYHYS